MAKKKTDAEVTVRVARPGDEAGIAGLIALLAEYEKAPERCEATPEKVREQLFGDSPAAWALVAEADGRMAGMALYFRSFSTWLCKPGIHLEDLFVLPEYRRRGIGQALLRALAQQCIQQGAGRLEWTCLEWNELAKAQYRKIGAEPMEEWRTWRMEGKVIEDLAEGRLPDAPGQQAPAAMPAGDKVSVPSPGGDPVVIYTDGGCAPNPGTGAWAAVLLSGDRRKEISGGEYKTTNNRMELLAAINALEGLRKPCTVELHTDSQYVRRGITEWIGKWKRHGWRRGKEPVKNVELWKRLDEAAARHLIRWHWVEGHTGDVENERCDELCQEEIQRLKAAGK